jgi:hypothetical protein
MKITMPFIDPDANGLVGEGFLDDQVSIAIIIYIPSSYCKCSCRRLKRELSIGVTGEVKLYSEISVEQAWIQKNGSIWLLIVIEICDRQSSSE